MAAPGPFFGGRFTVDADWSVEKVLEELGIDPDSREGLAIREAHEQLEKTDEQRKAHEMTGPTQYSIESNGSYTPVGNTVPKLRPGMYEPIIADGRLHFVPAAIRTDAILRFPDAVTDRVVKEIELFWEREEIFRQYGFPFKRGMLLYGPPGSGKSTTLQLVARDVINRGGFVLQFNAAWLNGYRAVRSIQPEVPIVTFMEDLDSLLEHRESSVLNLLDGAESLERVIFLATTNYPEKLDPRVKNRPSRFDRRFEVPHPGPEARRIYLEELCTKGDQDFDVERAVRDTEGFSLAHIKELFVANVIIGQPYEDALDDLRVMNGQNPKSTDGIRRPGNYV